MYLSVVPAAKRHESIEVDQSEWPGAQTSHTEAATPLRYHPRPRSTDQHLTSPHQPHHLPGFDSLTTHSLRHRRPCERAQDSIQCNGYKRANMNPTAPHWICNGFPTRCLNALPTDCDSASRGQPALSLSAPVQRLIPQGLATNGHDSSSGNRRRPLPRMRLSARADQRDSADNPLPPRTPPAGYGRAALRDAEKGDRFIFPTQLSAAPALAALSAHQQYARPHLRNGLYLSVVPAAKRHESIEVDQSEWPGAQTSHTEAAAPLRYHPRPRSTDQHLTSPHQPHHLPGFDSLTTHSLRHRRPCERAQDSIQCNGYKRANMNPTAPHWICNGFPTRCLNALPTDCDSASRGQPALSLSAPVQRLIPQGLATNGHDSSSGNRRRPLPRMRLSARADQRDSADNPLPPRTPPAGYGRAALRDAGNSVKQYVPFWAYRVPPSVEAFSVAEDLKINLSPFFGSVPPDAFMMTLTCLPSLDTLFCWSWIPLLSKVGEESRTLDLQAGNVRIKVSNSRIVFFINAPTTSFIL
ncbi:hypothetical protein PflQ2_3997 [Pseudomonas fluorescens Q2-87]|uniref:Uncharacterized protein n=1 Tax=Pseudomonas fluorescens (strain Q2-87) TaxID=1038922 RepID=J2EXD1_PSEFQ|nr:hypothetical protein PflQ2_3997 [Pseudomonas fluorescens Q2-87]